MGLVQAFKCVNLAMLPPDVWDQLQEEEFTVQRNPKGSACGKEESGWRIQKEPHSIFCRGHKPGCGPTDCAELGDAVATKYASGSGRRIWRVFMNNGFCEEGSREHCCGWRKCDPSVRTFWPTRCKTPIEREVWWIWFDAWLKCLPIMSDLVIRLPPIWEEEGIVA